MDLGPQNRAPFVTHEAHNFAELLGLIRAGHAGAVRQLHRFLSPGVQFLVQRRLGRNDVDRQVQSVLDAAIHTIRTDISVQADEVAAW